MLLNSCSAPGTASYGKAVYYWRSVFHINNYEKEFLERTGVHTLYIKYFDVEFDPSWKKPVPVASLADPYKQVSSLSATMNICPVVFITQPALQAMADSSLKTFASLIGARIMNMNKQFGIGRSSEWQIDCDWTEPLSGKYFALLSEIKKIAHSQRIELSVTLRLYPYKYRTKMGIPPADRVMLMCYNMGNLKNPATTNSIIDISEMKKYLTVNEPYPLPMDAALPLFSWYVWFRDREYKGLAYPGDIEGLTNMEVKESKLIFKKDTVINGRLFRQGDWLRPEQTNIETLLKARQLIDHTIAMRQISKLALFHIDSVILNKYPPNALEVLFGRDH